VGRHKSGQPDPARLPIALLRPRAPAGVCARGRPPISISSKRSR